MYYNKVDSFELGYVIIPIKPLLNHNTLATLILLVMVNVSKINRELE
jgi:hypothetical protein